MAVVQDAVQCRGYSPWNLRLEGQEESLAPESGACRRRVDAQAMKGSRASRHRWVVNGEGQIVGFHHCLFWKERLVMSV